MLEQRRTTMCTKGPECKRKGFRPEGCQVMEKGEPCAETDTLDIAKQFKRCYEEKMRIIEADQRPEAVQVIHTDDPTRNSQQEKNK